MGDEDGKKFLELIDEQSSLQWGIVARVAALIGAGWESEDIRREIEGMVSRHEEITRQLA